MFTGHKLRQLRFVCLSIISCSVAYPVLLLVFLPTLIFRFLVVNIVQLSNPKYKGTLQGLSAALPGPDLYSKPLMIEGPYLLLSKKLDRDHVIKSVNENWIHTGFYPELKQRLVRKYGYYFWQDVENFRVENHIRYLYPDDPEKVVLKRELRSCERSKLNVPFDKRYSPWELILVPNVVDPGNPKIKSAVFIRFNHCIADGLCLYKLVSKLSSTPYIVPYSVQQFSASKPNSSKISTYISYLLKVAEILLTGPYYAFDFLLNIQDNNEFLESALAGLDRNKSESDRCIMKSESPLRIPSATLNIIRKRYDVGISSVIIAAALEGVHKFMTEKCNSGFSKIPEQFTFEMVLPLPGHPNNKLVNYWSVHRMRINTARLGNPVSTLQKVHMNLGKLSKSIVPIVNVALLKLLGLLPVFIHPEPKNLQSQTLLMSNLPGPKNKVDFCGCDLEEWGVMASSPLVTAIYVLPQSLMDQIWIDCAGTPILFRDEQDAILLEKYIHEFNQFLATETSGEEAANIK